MHPFSTLWKYQKIIKVFLMFLGDRERVQWEGIGQYKDVTEKLDTA